MIMSKQGKKKLIQAIFLVPFFTCLFTVIGIKYFVDHHLSYVVCSAVDTQKIFYVIAFVLLINVVASFASLISYYCLENRVNDILKKREKNEKEQLKK